MATRRWALAFFLLVGAAFFALPASAQASWWCYTDGNRTATFVGPLPSQAGRTLKDQYGKQFSAAGMNIDDFTCTDAATGDMEATARSYRNNGYAVRVMATPYNADFSPGRTAPRGPETFRFCRLLNTPYAWVTNVFSSYEDSTTDAKLKDRIMQAARADTHFAPGETRIDCGGSPTREVAEKHRRDFLFSSEQQLITNIPLTWAPYSTGDVNGQ